mmetsp:Transcript_30097/g.52885  ORF Transcript_30097/g.52885 Transcript_30097/m.52885 type:complete len:208 (+) Transcript_30097:819-1442(+)
MSPPTKVYARKSLSGVIRCPSFDLTLGSLCTARNIDRYTTSGRRERNLVEVKPNTNVAAMPHPIPRINPTFIPEYMLRPDRNDAVLYPVDRIAYTQSPAAPMMAYMRRCAGVKYENSCFTRSTGSGVDDEKNLPLTLRTRALAPPLDAIAPMEDSLRTPETKPPPFLRDAPKDESFLHSEGLGAACEMREEPRQRGRRRRSSSSMSG